MFRLLSLSRINCTAILISIALVGLVCGVYAAALSGPFLFDDLTNIPPTRIDSFSLQELWRVATGNHSGLFSRSLPVLSFSINYMIGDGGPYGFKLVNLGLHVLCGFLWYLVLQNILSVVELRQGYASVWSSKVVASVVAAVWLLHPLQVSSVMYVVQRMNIMATLFILMSMLVYVKARAAQIQTGRITSQQFLATRFLLCAFFILLACLCKENGVLALLYLLLLELLIFRFVVAGETHHVFRSAVLIVLTCIILFLSLFLYFYGYQHLLLPGYMIRDFSLQERLLTQPGIVVDYLSQIVWPNLNQMSLYHDDRLVERTLSLSVMLSIGVLASLVVCAWLLRRAMPVVSMGIGIFLCSHLLESTFYPLELMFEHRNYFGLSGIALSIVCAFAALARRVGTTAPAIVVGLLLMVLAVQTHSRSLEWSSELSHNAIAAHNKPESLRAQTAYAITLVKQNRAEEAKLVLENALERGLDSAYISLNLVSLKAIYREVSDADIQRASAALSKRTIDLSHASTLLDLYFNFKRGAYSRPNLNDMTQLFAAVAGNPSKQLNAIGKGRIHELYAILLLEGGNLDTASAEVQQAYKFNKASVDTLLAKAEIEYADDRMKAFALTLAKLDSLTATLSPVQSQRFLDLKKVASHLDYSSLD